jgi:methylglyoxal synthase
VLGYLNRPLPARKRIALIAHDHKKHELHQWASFNRELLQQHDLIATQTTARVIEDVGLQVTPVLSGPLGGDLQIGSAIGEGRVDVLVFFWDPLQPLPHDPDIRALLRVAVVWNIPIACNWSSADFLISSGLMGETYSRKVCDYSAHLGRAIPGVAEPGRA